MGFPAKGGRFLEAVAKADTIVFGKTGTLNYAMPTVAAVIPFGGHDEADMCISSLFNISVARFRTLFIRLTHSIWAPAFSVSVDLCHLLRAEKLLRQQRILYCRPHNPLLT